MCKVQGGKTLSIDVRKSRGTYAYNVVNIADYWTFPYGSVDHRRQVDKNINNRLFVQIKLKMW
uniref:Uncharacterized protein n=1 Tax=Anguilla anguilla TaxID=7936 RepID=A0A0E9WHS1_ANGAN